MFSFTTLECAMRFGKKAVIFYIYWISWTWHTYNFVKIYNVWSVQSKFFYCSGTEEKKIKENWEEKIPAIFYLTRKENYIDKNHRCTYTCPDNVCWDISMIWDLSVIVRYKCSVYAHLLNKLRTAVYHCVLSLIDDCRSLQDYFFKDFSTSNHAYSTSLEER